MKRPLTEQQLEALGYAVFAAVVVAVSAAFAIIHQLTK